MNEETEHLSNKFCSQKIYNIIKYISGLPWFWNILSRTTWEVKKWPPSQGGMCLIWENDCRKEESRTTKNNGIKLHQEVKVGYALTIKKHRKETWWGPSAPIIAVFYSFTKAIKHDSYPAPNWKKLSRAFNPLLGASCSFPDRTRALRSVMVGPWTRILSWANHLPSWKGWTAVLCYPLTLPSINVKLTRLF